MSEIKKCSECQFWSDSVSDKYPTCYVDPTTHFRSGDSPPCALILKWMEDREGGVEVTVLSGGDPVFLTEGDA